MNVNVIGAIGAATVFTVPDIGSVYFLFNPFLSKLASSKANPLQDRWVKQRFEKEGFFNIPEPQHGYQRSLTLSVTHLCNLGCVYCYAEPSKRKKAMRFDIAKSVIDNYLKELGRDQNPMISFYGSGEPTLNMALVEKVVNYIRNELGYENPSFSITSHCYFKEDVLSFLMENDFYVCASVDGEPETQDLQRPLLGGKNSSEIVHRNIKAMAAADAKFHARSTITSNSVHKMKDITQFLYEQLGVSNVYLEPVEATGACQNEPSIVPSVQDFYNNFIQAVTYANERAITLNTETLRNIKSGIDSHYCGSLAGYSLLVTADGKRSFCYEVLEDGIQQVFIGDVFSGENESTKAFPVIPLINNNDVQCNTCSIRYICGGTCPKRAHGEHACFDKPYSWQCLLSRKLIPFALGKIAEATFPVST